MLVVNTFEHNSEIYCAKFCTYMWERKNWIRRECGDWGMEDEEKAGWGIHYWLV